MKRNLAWLFLKISGLRKFGLIPALTAAFLLPAFSQVADQGVPTTLMGRSGGLIWISAEELIEKLNGQALNKENLDFLPYSFSRSIWKRAERQRKWIQERKQKNEPTDGCYGVSGPVLISNQERQHTFRVMVDRSKAIYMGEIVRVDNGFFNGRVTKLLTLELHQILKTYETSNPRVKKYYNYPESTSKRIYLNYPNVEISIDDVTFCSGNAYFHEPRIGTRMLLFFFTPAFDADGSFFHLSEEKIFMETSEGKALIPPGMLLDNGLRGVESFPQVVSLTRRLLLPKREIKGEKK